MVLKKLLSFFYNLIGFRRQPRIKEPPPNVEVGSGFSENPKDGGSDSPAGLSSGEAFEGDLCCVCLSRLKEGENISVLHCLHKFHKVCINKWFDAYRKTCPVCRFSMGEEIKCQGREELTEEMLIWFSSFHVAGF